MTFLNFNYDPNLDMYVEAKVANKFVARSIGWMLLGLLTTFATLVSILVNPELFSFIARNPIISIVAGAAMMGISFSMGMMVNASSQFLSSLFIVYSALNGIFLSFLGIYDAQTLLFTLFATSLLFGIMAVYGYLTESDLSGLGPLVFVALLTLLLLNVANMFIGLESFSLAIGYMGAMVFMVMIAYKINQLKQMAAQIANTVGEENVQRYSVYGAFSLYLSFINLFLYILRIVSSRRKK